MEQVDFVPIVVRWIHIAAAITAIGGAIFMRLAVMPVLRDAVAEDERRKLADAMRGRWGMVVHTCIALLLLTGVGNFVLLALHADVKPMPYHALFGIKFLLALVVFFFASALVAKGPGLARMRERPAGPLTAVVVLGLLVALLSGVLNQIRHSPGAKKPPPSANATDVP